jgi:SAM-dependent methyltransferase
MSGVRMGERLLQIGLDDPAVAGMIAAKVGLSGSAAAAVEDQGSAARAQASAAEAGVLVDVQTTPLTSLPFPDAGFDVVVVHTTRGRLPSLDAGARMSALKECHRVLRHGGRLVAIEAGRRSGLSSLFGSGTPSSPEYEAAGGTVAALESAGFRPVRLVGDLEGFRFIEGLKS